MLDIDANYHFMQFQRKLMNLFLENGKKPSFSPDFGLFFAQIWSPKILFVGFTSSRCYTLLQAIIVCNFKDNTKLTKTAKNPPSFCLDFCPFGLNLGPPNFFWWILSLLDVISRKTNEPTLRK